ncbi:MAG: class Ib ribonucleoside-diphosphate reductase assembly flavoprotein NrdI [Chitinophagaceae bacterium]
MIIYYDSLTGNTKRFVEKVQKQRPDWEIIKINPKEKVERPGHLITFTIGIGNIPLTTTVFVKNNKDKILSVSSTGNRNWGEHFGEAADKIAKHYKIPFLMKVEMSGLQNDVQDFIGKIEDSE